MNKTDLITAIATEAGLTKAQSMAALQAFEVAVITALANGQEVRLTGFGSFKVKARAERQASNPKTGEKVTVPAGRKPVFKAGKALSEAVS